MNIVKFSVVTCVTAVALPVQAEVLSITGDVETVAAPSNVERNVFTSNTHARLFAERKRVDQGNVLINAVIPGHYNAYSDFQDAVIQDPPLFDSYFLHFDPVRGEGFVDGTITFATPMLGVIGRSLTMQQTDGTLGAVGTLYPTRRFDREPEYQNRGNYDYFEMSNDMKTFSFRLRATDLDQLRIVVASVPEPSTLGIVACAFGLILLRRGGGR